MQKQKDMQNKIGCQGKITSPNAYLREKKTCQNRFHYYIRKRQGHGLRTPDKFFSIISQLPIWADRQNRVFLVVLFLRNFVTVHPQSMILHYTSHFFYKKIRFSYILKVYCKRAIIRRGLYIFYPIFHCGLYCRAYGRAVSIADNLCTKRGNSPIFGLKICSL